MTVVTWSREELSALLSMIRDRLSYAEISVELTRRFGRTFTPKSVKSRMTRHLAATRKAAAQSVDDDVEIPVDVDMSAMQRATVPRRQAPEPVELPRRSAQSVENLVRVIIPDSHGEHIDRDARGAFLDDLKALDPHEIVMLGDHLDCGGTFSSHQRSYTNEMTESYADDVNAGNVFLDLIQLRAPRARTFYLEGNHEQHVERWAAREFASHKDAVMMVEHLGPENVLHLRRRGISYYNRATMYMGLSIPGTIKLGDCFFVHGISHAKNADAAHLARFGANVVFGHVHRVQSTNERTVTSSGFGAWCPGTLAKLQPLYRHTEPTSWSHGYGVQFVAKSGEFIHINVPIHKGKSLLELTGLLGRMQSATAA